MADRLRIEIVNPRQTGGRATQGQCSRRRIPALTTYSRTLRILERLLLAAVLLGLTWVIALSVANSVGLAQENPQQQDQPESNDGQLRVCHTDPETEALLCTGWIDPATLPEDTAQPELNCPYGTYWDEKLKRIRCRPRCYQIKYVGWFCHPLVTPVPPCPGNKVWDPTSKKCRCPTGQVDTGNNRCKVPTATPGPTLTKTPPPPPPCPGDKVRDESKKKCTCPSGKEDVGNNQCEPPCPGDKVRDGTGCRCPDGTKDVGNNQCKKPPTPTPTPTPNPTPLPPLTPPSGLKLTRSGDDLELTYNRGSGSARHYRFNLYRDAADPGDLSTKTIPDSYLERQFRLENKPGKTTFKDVADEEGWYYVIARTCRSKTGTSCGSRFSHSNTVEIKEAFISPPTQTVIAEPPSAGTTTDISLVVNYPGGAPAGGASVSLDYSGSAVRGADYTAPDAVKFAGGETKKTISLKVRHDNGAPDANGRRSGQEPDETIGIEISGITTADPAAIYSDDEHEFTITDLIGPVLVANNGQISIDVNAPTTDPVRLRLRLQTNGFTLTPGSYDSTGRLFQIEARTYKSGQPNKQKAVEIAESHTVASSHDSATSTLASDDARLQALPDYVHLDHGIANWREGQDPYDNRYLQIELKPSATASSAGHDTFRITIAKPDFAIVARPVLTRRSNGDYAIRTSVYNSLKINSRNIDSGTGINYICYDGISQSQGEHVLFADLRPSGANRLLAAQSEKAVQIPAKCTGAAYLNKSHTVRSSVQLYQRTNPRDKEDEKIKPQRTYPRILGSKGFTGPDRDDTLWAPAAAVAGGWQMVEPKAPCTLSFGLNLRKQSNGRTVPAASTTAHCAEEKGKDKLPWQQGTTTLLDWDDSDNPNNLLGDTELYPDTALPSTRTRCKILESANGDPDPTSNCHRGDQSYATIDRSDGNLAQFDLPTGRDNLLRNPLPQSTIFRPKRENTIGETGLSVGHFTDSGTSFRIVGARPPKEGEMVHKVGRTTGWTSGMVKAYDDPTCPGGKLGDGDNKPDDVYIECLARADYVSLRGDSGAPVFVRGAGRTVELVGVHMAGELDWVFPEYALFVPIDRIYAEALLNGYEWELAALRPLPQLGDDNDDADDDTESLWIDRGKGAATATFSDQDFSWSKGIVYEVGLFQRKNGQWGAKPIADVQVAYAYDDAYQEVAKFTGLAIPADASATDFKVRVRMNAKPVSGITATDALNHFSAWGPDSTVTPVFVAAGPERIALAGIAGVTAGQSQELGVSASGLDADSDYVMALSSSSNAGFDSTCRAQSKSMALPEKADRFTDTIDVYGCTAGKATFSAELKRDGRMVARARTRTEIAPAPTIDLTLPDSLPRGGKVGLRAKIANLDPAKTYKIRLALGGDAARLDAACTKKSQELAVPAGSRAHTGRADVFGCKAGKASATATLLTGGDSLAAAAGEARVLDQEIALSALPDTLGRGARTAFTVSARNLDPGSSHSLKLSAGAGLGFDSGCAATARTIAIPAASSAHRQELQLYACSGEGADVNAALLQGSATLKSATATVKVVKTPSTPATGRIAFAGGAGLLRVGQSSSYTLKLSALDPERGYTARVVVSTPGAGFDSGCTETTRDVAIPAAKSSWESAKITLHTCARGLIKFSATLASYGQAVSRASSDVAVL